MAPRDGSRLVPVLPAAGATWPAANQVAGRARRHRRGVEGPTGEASWPPVEPLGHRWNRAGSASRCNGGRRRSALLSGARRTAPAGRTPGPFTSKARTPPVATTAGGRSPVCFKATQAGHPTRFGRWLVTAATSGLALGRGIELSPRKRGPGLRPRAPRPGVVVRSEAGAVGVTATAALALSCPSMVRCSWSTTGRDRALTAPKGWPSTPMGRASQQGMALATTPEAGDAPGS
jgi:hypothetical protein